MDSSTSYETFQQAASALSGAFKSITKHLDNDDQNKVVKAIRNTFPQSFHSGLLDDWADLRAHQSRSGLTRDQARTEAERMLKTEYMGLSTVRTAVRVLEQHGAVLDQNSKSLLCSLDTGAVEYKKGDDPTDEERYQKAEDTILSESERSFDFMNAKNPGHLWNRNTELRHILETGERPSNHPYVINKKGLPVNGPAVCSAGILYIPMTNAIWPEHWSGWQTIDEYGEKSFMKGQPTRGQFYPIGCLQDADVILVCEGMATGESLHAATHLPVACALSMHNILNVAVSLLHPEFEIKARRVLICADTGHDADMKKFVRIIRSRHSDNRIDWVLPEVAA
jgi:hypothetical protein